MNVLVVVAHPDDETIGCGGTLARHAHAQDVVRVLIFADGVSSRPLEPEKLEKAIWERQAACRQACKTLGVQSVEFLNLKDQLLDTVPISQLSKIVEKTLDEFKPEIVYTHFYGDLNQDHRQVSEAVKVACRPQTGVRRLLFFEVASSTEWQTPQMFSPNWFVELTQQHIILKISALNIYREEMRRPPHPRSQGKIIGLNETRGGSVCVCYAEAFVVGRIIERYDLVSKSQ